MRRCRDIAGRAVMAVAALLLSGGGAVLAQPQPQPQPQPVSCRVALDIGHHLAAPGAISACGVTEWTFNHRLALLVAEDLRRRYPGIEPVVMNPDGAPLSLKDRAAQAEALHADLFVSLHHDSVQPKYLHPWVCQGRAGEYADQFSGYGVFVSARNPQFALSQMMADSIATALQAQGQTPSLHHAEPIPHENRPLLDRQKGIYRFDDLVVLHQTTMPAVLIEAGIISNRRDEQALAGNVLPPRIAQAVAEGIARTCSGLVPAR